jgi:uncharacterized protein
MGRVSEFVTAVAVGVIRAYQYLVSPWLGGNCRYAPTCSEYAAEAMRQYGPIRGGWMALKRILRCNPWAAAGYDPVPDGCSPNLGKAAPK